jgi:hypothetical protein
MLIQILVRNGLASEWISANPTLAMAELGVETDTGRFKVGDGVTSWSLLSYSNMPFDVINIAAVQKGGIISSSAASAATFIPVGGNGQIFGVSSSDSTLPGWVNKPSFQSLQDVSITSLKTNDLMIASRFLLFVWQNISQEQILIDNRTLLSSLAWGASAGYVSRGMLETTVYKWTLPVETFSTTTAALASMYLHAGFANFSVAGYFNRGAQDGQETPTNTVYKWIFQTDAVSVTASAPIPIASNAGFANPAVAGYFSRGINALNLDVYKWTFPTDLVSTTTSAPANMLRHGGFANPSVAGYFSRSNNTTTVYKWTFPTDTVVATVSAPATMEANAGFANPSVAGYFSRGQITTTVYKWAFPSDTVSTTTSSPVNLAFHAGFSNPTIAGYFSSGDFDFNLNKWSFPADTRSAIPSPTNRVGANAAFSNGY